MSTPFAFGIVYRFGAKIINGQNNPEFTQYQTGAARLWPAETKKRQARPDRALYLPFSDAGGKLLHHLAFLVPLRARVLHCHLVFFHALGAFQFRIGNISESFLNFLLIQVHHRAAPALGASCAQTVLLGHGFSSFPLNTDTLIKSRFSDGAVKSSRSRLARFRPKAFPRRGT
jgi:hypothetical protein